MGLAQSIRHLRYSRETRCRLKRSKQPTGSYSSGMSLVYDTSARTEIIEIFKKAYEAGVPTSFDLNLRVDDGKLDPEYEKAVREVIRYTTYLLGSGNDEFKYLGEGRDWRENAKATRFRRESCHRQKWQGRILCFLERGRGIRTCIFR